jgi:hypothetical protein
VLIREGTAGVEEFLSLMVSGQVVQILGTKTQVVYLWVERMIPSDEMAFNEFQLYSFTEFL